MRPSQNALTLLVAGLLVSLAACTVYVVPAEESGTAMSAVDEEDADAEEARTAEEAEAGGEVEEPADGQPRGREARRRSNTSDEDHQARLAEEREAREAAEREAREAAEREAAEREARLAAEREAREAAERQAAEREARLAAEREARLAQERESRQAAERAAREAAEREAAEREARLAAERDAREAAEREAAEREARLAAEREARFAARDRARRGARDLHVPPGQHPPAGECRIWYEGTPPGRQPSPAPCEDLLQEEIGAGAFILYDGESWDGAHDWEAAAVAHPGAVPRAVLALSRIVAESGDRSGAGDDAVTAATIDVPSGQYPPDGLCRVWYEGRSAGRQPPAAPCGELELERGAGAFILYDGAPWDVEYDWERLEAERPGTVPPVLLELLTNADDEKDEEVRGGEADEESEVRERPPIPVDPTGRRAPGAPL